MVGAVLLSGGVGSRMQASGMPKQYMELCGSPMIMYSIRTFDKHPDIDGMVIVADPQWREPISAWMRAENIQKFVAYADPGETRQYSILSGLRALDAHCEAVASVIIHDAARPLVSRELISRCLSGLDGHDGALPILKAKDTYYLTDSQGRVERLLPRARLAAGQAPEAFAFRKYYQAHLDTGREELLKITGSTELAVIRGLDVTTVEGDERNIKITTPNDLDLAEAYIRERERQSS